MMERIKQVAKYLLIVMVAVVLYRGIWPAYSGAWRAQRLAEKVASQSAGKTRKDVADAYLDALKGAKLGAIERDSLVIDRDGEKWIVGADFELMAPVYKKIQLVYEFSIASDRKMLWAVAE